MLEKLNQYNARKTTGFFKWLFINSRFVDEAIGLLREYLAIVNDEKESPCYILPAGC